MSEEKKLGKILLAEDDKFLAVALGDKLTREGFVVSKAINGEEAAEKIKSEQPDLVLLDLIMPRKNGFEVLAEMKLSPETRHIPVIVLSNLGQETDVQKAKELGASDYLVKSDVEIKTVVEKIKTELARKHHS